MPFSCNDLRTALAECLAQSDCVLVQRNKAGDCLRLPLVETLPAKCLQLKQGLGDCKRGLIDMRKRFRGHRPVNLSSDQSSPRQLYAGAPAVTHIGSVAESKPAGPAEGGEKLEK